MHGFFVGGYCSGVVCRIIEHINFSLLPLDDMLALIERVVLNKPTDFQMLMLEER